MQKSISIRDRIVEGLCLALLCASSIYLVMMWKQIPKEIPAHYNAIGEVDRWGDKGELLIMPIMSWILYLFITALEAFPQIWNTGVTVTEQNKERVYRILKNMIGTVKFLMVGFFAIISFYQIKAETMPALFLPISMGLLFGSLIYYIIKLFKNQ